MNVGLAAQAIDYLVSGGRVGLVALDEDDIGASLGQGKGHGLANATSAAGDEGSAPAEGEERCHRRHD